MKLHGYCTSCRKIKQVNVSPASLGGKGVPMGVCDDCASTTKK